MIKGLAWRLRKPFALLQPLRDDPGLCLCLGVPYAMGSPNVLIKLFWLSQGISQPVIFTVKKALETHRSLQNKKQPRDTHLHPVLSLPFFWFLEQGKLCWFYFLVSDFLVCDSGCSFISFSLPASVSSHLHHTLGDRKLLPHWSLGQNLSGRHGD